MTLEIVKSTYAHAEPIGNNLRRGDWAELFAMGYTSGRHAMLACLKDCPDSVTCLEDGAPIAAWGYKRDDMLCSDTAYLWCMTTPAVERHKRSILRFSRDFCDSLLLHFGRLESAVSPIYPQSERWTRWLGFEPVSRIVLGGAPFDVIVKMREA